MSTRISYFVSVVLALTIIFSINASGQVRAIMDNFRNEYNQTYELPYAARRPARIAIEQKFKNLLTAIVPEDIADSLIVDAYIKRHIGSTEVKNLSLSYNDSKAYILLKREYDLSYGSLESNKNTPIDIVLARRSEIESQYRTAVKSLLGPQKYITWLKFDESSHKRFYMQTFEFTEIQYRQFIEIEQEYALSVAAINDSSITHDKKAALKEKAYDTRLASIREILTDKQYGKWLNTLKKNEAYNDGRW